MGLLFYKAIFGIENLIRVLFFLFLVCCQSRLALASDENREVSSDSIARIEEVIVTAQRREERLQDTPIAITALNASALEKQGIRDLLDLSGGAIPTLKVIPFPNDRSILQIGIRGLTQADVGQFTKEGSVGVYMDGVYLGRSQGLGMEMVKVERLEVLRGPQGALYGRNTLGGALNIVTSKPSFEELWGEASLEMGRYDLQRAKIQLNMPLSTWLAGSIGLATSERSGWVDNPGDEADWNSWDKWGARFDLRAQPGEDWVVDLAYDRSSIDSTQVYYQFRRIEIEPGSGLPWADVALEPSRLDRSRFDVGLPNRPNESSIKGFMVSPQWQYSIDHSVKYIGATRSLETQLSNNFGGVFLVGNSTVSDDTQNQTSHELQFQGDFNEAQLEYSAGFYLYSEETEENQEQLLSILPVGQDGLPLLALANPSVLNLPVTLLPYSQRDQLSLQGQLVLNAILVPAQGEKDGMLRAANYRQILGDTRSKAAYFQTTWAPPILNSKIELTLGLRYTDDDKKFVRAIYADVSDGTTKRFKGRSTTPSFTANFHWTDELSTWFKWTNGWRSGGVNSRSATFLVYDADEVEMYEIGWKSLLWDGRARFNGALFSLNWYSKQVDFSDPQNISISETINASTEDPKHKGAEFDLQLRPIAAITMSLAYQFLDIDSTEQYNPVIDQIQTFPAVLAPEHSASYSMSYEKYLGWATLGFDASMNWTTAHTWNSTDTEGGHEYALFNAGFGFTEINMGGSKNNFSIYFWGKNLTDREWVTHQIQSQFSLAKAFGDPRTYGVNIKYSF